MADMVALPPSREVLGTGDPSMQCDVYSSGTASFLLTIPAEVLERIAFYVCTLQPTGPPAIRPLLSACRAINQTLTPDRNAALYADVFRAKFDAAAIRRRLGPWEPSSSALRDELVRRFLALKRIRTGAARFKYHVDDTPSPFAADPEDEGDLWTLLLIMLEDDGLNARQAKEYANADAWLETYWLRTPREVLIHPSRFGQAAMQPWIPDSGRNALAMWCFWILLRPDRLDQQDLHMHDALRIMSLAGNKFALVSPSWTEYLNHDHPVDFPTLLSGYLGHPRLVFSPPPLSAPAICCFYGLENTPRVRRRSHHDLPLINSTDPLPPALPSAAPRGARGSREWDAEFARIACLGAFRTGPLQRVSAPFRPIVTGALRAFRPGSLHGVWEGMFTYTEFQTYAALLAGGPPSIHRADVAQHRQTWRLREHHLLTMAADSERLDEDQPMGMSLPSGEALSAYIPKHAFIQESDGRLLIQHQGKEHIYHTCISDGQGYAAAEEVPDGYNRHVGDVIITGEGHSSWGQFTLRGRVRPLDGFISVVKHYTNGGSRGDWLYRALLVGDKHGNLAGRWRETLTPPDQDGYEGCFTLSRRG